MLREKENPSSRSFIPEEIESHCVACFRQEPWFGKHSLGMVKESANPRLGGAILILMLRSKQKLSCWTWNHSYVLRDDVMATLAVKEQRYFVNASLRHGYGVDFFLL